MSNGNSENCDYVISDAPVTIAECTTKCGDDLSVKYLVPKPPWEYFGMNVPWKRRSLPRAVAAVKKLTALLLTSESVSPSARPSAATISVWHILSRIPSGNISVTISHENKGSHFELQQQWRIWLHAVWCWNLSDQVHVQVRRWSRYQISCPESPLEIFQWQYVSHENKGAHLDLGQQWRFRLHCCWRWNLSHQVHVQVRWRSRYQISCPESPLEIFQC